MGIFTTIIAACAMVVAQVSSQNPGTGTGGSSTSCCVDLSTPSCAAAYAYCRNSTVAGACQSLLCPKSVSPSPSAQRPRPPPPTQTQTPSVVAIYTIPTAYPSNTATGTVSHMQSSSATGGGGFGLAPTSPAASGASSPSETSTVSISAPSSTQNALSNVGGISAPGANVIAVVAVTVCGIMIVGLGGFVIMRKWSKAQKNIVVLRKTPEVKTVNPIHEFKDNYINTTR